MKKNKTTIELILISFQDLLDRFNYIKTIFKDLPYPPGNIDLYTIKHKDKIDGEKSPVSYYICSCVKCYINKKMYPMETLLVLNYYLKNIPKELLDRSYWCINQNCMYGVLSPEEVLRLGYSFWNYRDIDSRIAFLKHIINNLSMRQLQSRILDNNIIEYYRECSVTGDEYSVKLTQEESKFYELGELNVQDFLFHLSADQREFLITGITPAEWNEMFKNYDDEY